MNEKREKKHITSIFYNEQKEDKPKRTPSLLEVIFDIDLYKAEARCWLKGKSEPIIQKNSKALAFSLDDTVVSPVLQEPYESDGRFFIEVKRFGVNLIKSGERNKNCHSKRIDKNSNLKEYNLINTIKSYFSVENKNKEEKDEKSINYYEVLKKYINQYTTGLGFSLIAIQILALQGIHVSQNPEEDSQLTIEFNADTKTLKFCNEIILYDGVELKTRDNAKKNQRSDIRLSKSEDREKIGKIKITYIVNDLETQQPKFDKIFIDIEGEALIKYFNYLME